MLIIAAMIVATFFPQTGSAADAPAKRPNVLLILCDDLGYGDLSCFGAKDLRSPNVDAFAARGMQFSHCYANCPVCSPSRAALMSGMYPDRVGVPGLIRTNLEDNFGYLSHRALLLPAILKDAGYHTGIVGKWNLGLEPENSPNARGFDFFHGFLGDMMMDYWTHMREGHNYMRLNDEEIDPKGHATDLFTQWSIDYIHERAADAKSGKQPFFLYLAYNAPHRPIQPPPEWLERVRKRESGISDLRAKMVALIEHLDDGVGKVLASLKDEGLEDNTVVIFTSDNGGDMPAGASNGTLRGTKGEMYEGGFREPTAMVWPGHIPPGSKSDRIVVHMDILPTICEAAGIKLPHEVDGISFLPILEGRAPQGPDYREIYWVRREGGPFSALTSHAIRRGDWKLIHNTPFSPLELYNLKDDPHEQNNVAATNPKIVRELSRQLKLHVLQSGSVPWLNPDLPPGAPIRASTEPSD
jgi:arylsulfatase A-like enzyme